MPIAVKFSMALCLSAVLPLALAVTPAEQAFLDGHAIAQSAKTGATANITNGAIANTVNSFNPNYYQYSTTAPEAGLFAGGNGDTLSAGSNKITSCQTGAANPNLFLQQNCDAINFMAGNTARRPQFTINSNDPLLVNSRSIQNNAGTLAAQSLGFTSPSAIGSFTGCTTTTSTTPPTYTTEICSDAIPATTQTCSVGRTIVVNAYANYSCAQTSNAYETQTCNRTLNPVVTPVPFCSIAGSFTGLASSTYKCTVNSRGKTTCVTGTASFYDVTFSCAGSSIGQVTVGITGGQQCHGGGCNSNYYTLSLPFVPGTNAGPVSGYLAMVYDGTWWHYTTISYTASTNTVAISTTSTMVGNVNATVTPSGTVGIRYDITSSWIDGCATQAARAL